MSNIRAMLECSDPEMVHLGIILALNKGIEWCKIHLPFRTYINTKLGGGYTSNNVAMISASLKRHVYYKNNIMIVCSSVSLYCTEVNNITKNTIEIWTESTNLN